MAPFDNWITVNVEVAANDGFHAIGCDGDVVRTRVIAGGGKGSHRRVTCSGMAPSRTGAFATLDRQTETLYLFGGLDSSSMHRHDLWRASRLTGSSGCSWELIPQQEPSPSAREFGTLLMNPRTHELMLYGGTFSDNGLSDAWVVRRNLSSGKP